MVTYLQQHDDGTVGRLSEHFEFYMDSVAQFDETLMKWIVRGNIKLKVKDYSCIGNPIFVLSVDGEDKSNRIWRDNVLFEDGEYILGSFTNNYCASFTEQNITVCASFILDANNKGPATCLLEASLKIPAVLDASGIMLATDAGASTVALRLVNMPTTLEYIRKLKFYYKKSIDTEYQYLDTELITCDITSYTRYISDLVPGVSYDFKCEIYTCTDENLAILERTYLVPLKTPILDVLYRKIDNLIIKVSALDSIVSYDRILRMSYRTRGSLDWIDVGTSYAIAASSIANDYRFNVSGLAPGTHYEFMLEVSSESVVLFRKSLITSTQSEQDENEAFSIVSEGAVVHINVCNLKLNSGTKTLNMYLQDSSNQKYKHILSTDSSSFRTGFTSTITLDLEETVDEGGIFKLIFSDSITGVVEDIRFISGG